ncbi:ABC transporter permease [Diplocloster agilis]|uniref:ABC transporter permease n=1 Tax=Diplocloster agilis TaxID=2850323 RepID=UPI000821D88A|nr:ABC transporter permease [Suonthocola fibrivorans]MCU6733483.1 ABC transporter permease [Suonthocola fibrivorans]SCI94563.1 Ribose transport system permease protein rbsC [uncultured Clostridium sp.]
MKTKKIELSNLVKILPFAVLCIVTGIINPVFFSISNLIDLARSISFLLIVSVGVTYVLLGASLDLSIGSVMGLGGAICGLCLVNQVPIPLAIGAGLLVSGLVGMLNALLIVNLQIPALIATLGTMYIARGVVNVLTKGEPYYPLPDAFKALGQGTLAGIPYSVFLALVIVAVSHFIIKKTSYGRSLMAVGGNKEASRLSGINVKRILFTAHVYVAVLAGFVGVILASRLSSAQPNSGDGWEMTAVAAVIIGGTSMYGGYGSVLGTILGCAMMEVLSNAMVLLHVSVYWQKIAIGIIMIAAVGMDTFRLRKMSGNV